MKHIALTLALTLTCMSGYAQKQDKQEDRAAKKEARAAQKQKKADALAIEITEMLTSKEYRFHAERAISGLSRKPYIDLAGDDYSVQVEGEEISLQLPYYGEGHSAMIGLKESPITFDAPITSYSVRGNLASENGLTIVIETKGTGNLHTMLVLYVFDNSDARLMVRVQGLSDIEFIGYIDKAENIK